MSKDGETRTEIGERLVARVEFARARYDSLRSEAKALRELADACLGNSVLEIQRYGSANQRANEALTAYQRAIQDLNDFVLRGKMPTDLEQGSKSTEGTVFKSGPSGISELRRSHAA